MTDIPEEAVDGAQEGVAYVDVVPDSATYERLLNRRIGQSDYQKTYLAGLHALKQALEPVVADLVRRTQLSETDLTRMSQRHHLDRINKQLPGGTENE